MYHYKQHQLEMSFENWKKKGKYIPISRLELSLLVGSSKFLYSNCCLYLLPQYDSLLHGYYCLRIHLSKKVFSHTPPTKALFRQMKSIYASHILFTKTLLKHMYWQTLIVLLHTCTPLILTVCYIGWRDCLGDAMYLTKNMKNDDNGSTSLTFRTVVLELRLTCWYWKKHSISR